MYFKDMEHTFFYMEKKKECKRPDPYNTTIFYLFGLTEETRKHFDRVFNMEEGLIIPEGLNEPWQTGTTIAITRLAFNLYNGFTGREEIDTPEKYSVENIFCKTGLALYFYEAIRNRFEF